MQETSPATAKKRIDSLDLLRGTIVLLAILQHYVGFHNFWYEEYTYLRNFTLPFYDDIRLLYESKTILHAEGVLFYIGTALIPWLTHLYLALACFNLASREQEEFKKVYKSKTKIFGMLFVLFYLENIAFYPSIGYGLSIFPLQIFLAVLAIITLCYRFLGVRAIAILMVLTLTRYLLPGDPIGDHFEKFMVLHVHPLFEYDARLEHFLATGCFGFLIGYVFYHKKEWRVKLAYLGLGLSVIRMATWFAVDDPYLFNIGNVYHLEDAWTDFFGGNLMIFACVFLSIFLTLWARHLKLSKPPLSWILWVGQASLFVFLLHRMIGIYILFPLREYISIVFSYPMKNSFFENAVLIISCVLICRFLKSTQKLI